MQNFFAGTIISTMLLCSTGALGQQALQPLSERSRAEFDRIFGTSAPSQDDGASISDLVTFQRDATMAQMTVAMTGKASPKTTRKLSQILLLNKPSSPAIDASKAFHYWHAVALDTTSNDHAPPAALHGLGPAYQQVGPARTSRALAMLHIAMFEVVNLLQPGTHTFVSYLFDSHNHHFEAKPVVSPADSDELVVAAALNEVAYQTLSELYPGLRNPIFKDGFPGQCAVGVGDKRPFGLDNYYDCFAALYDKPETQESYKRGVAIGRAVAEVMRKRRSDDNSGRPERSIGVDFTLRDNPDSGLPPLSQWNYDPVSKAKTALGAGWDVVTPFALKAADEFRPPENILDKYRDALNTRNFNDLPSYKAIKSWGCDATYGHLDKEADCLNADALKPEYDGYLIAKFWAYDGTAGLCAPARLYNEIVDAILAQFGDKAGKVVATQNLATTLERARLYALANAAMADAAIAAWDAKYFFQFPRPVTVIRGELNGHPTKDIDYPTTWFPVGGQISNSDGGVNITPPFPAYISGHAAFGGALFGILRQFFATDTKFAFLSDEFNGHNKDAFNYIRCAKGGVHENSKFCASRNFTFDCAERENADSRLVMGVHWIFDADAGIHVGNQVAARAYRKLFVDMKDSTNSTGKARFSAEPAATRETLKCKDVTWPAKWVEWMDDNPPYSPTLVDKASLHD